MRNIKLSNSVLKIITVSLFLFIASVVITQSGTNDYDILIKGTTIVDGTGKPGYVGDVAIKGEKIAAVGRVTGSAKVIIDGAGLVTSPGFIDPHSHADGTILTMGGADLATNLLMQGITMVVGGNCGNSTAPQKKVSFGQWLSKLEKNGTSINYGGLVGHNRIRSFVMGDDFKRQAKPDEIKQMKDQVAIAMQEGAFGLSTGLDYFPGEYANTEEIIALAKSAAEHGGLYATHIRHNNSNSPADSMEEWKYGVYHGPAEDMWVGRYRGLLEAIEIGRQAQIPLHISHFKNVFRIPQPHPDFLEESATKASLWYIDESRKEGMDVTFDVIISPSNIAMPGKLIDSFINSYTYALDWLKEYDQDSFMEKIRAGKLVDKIRTIHNSAKLKLGKCNTQADPYWMDRFKILECANSDYVEKTIHEVALMRNMDPFDVLFEILKEDPDTIWIQHLDERDLAAAKRVLVKHPQAMICTDTNVLPPVVPPGGFKAGGYTLMPAPIYFGMYADYLGNFVREQSILALEEAVMKATLLPAQRLGLDDRGKLAPDYYADVVIFDINTIKMMGTYLKPDQPPEGIKYVFVNGVLTYKDKVHTGALAGKVIRHR
ncbi:amidohydrolase family protein [Acidobacteriota bacterium]